MYMFARVRGVSVWKNDSTKVVRYCVIGNTVVC